MCDHRSPVPFDLQRSKAISQVISEAGNSKCNGKQHEKSSRRKRLWELPNQVHCPLIGVCLPMPVLRRLFGKNLSTALVADDYEFHVAAVSECMRRRPLAEAMQRELDRRYSFSLRKFAQAKTTEALQDMWQAGLHSCDVAGALWATLSHPRCDENLREQVCRDIHMFQHQVGACNRADLQRLEQLQESNQAMEREQTQQKELHCQQLLKRDAQIQAQGAELMRLRGQIIQRDSWNGALQDELERVRATVPNLSAREDLARRLELQRHRIHELEQHRSRTQMRAELAEQRIAMLETQLTARSSSTADQTPETNPRGDAIAALRDKAVLCVGGRAASVPIYRQIIEVTGGKFLHHDGGEEHSAAQLESSLAAADLVICQTGCINHGAYWRVKDHCKRHGKRCVFVDKPSASSLARSLGKLEENEA